jgi:hypothetical protein
MRETVNGQKADTTTMLRRTNRLEAALKEAHFIGLNTGVGRTRVSSTFARIHEAEFIPSSEQQHGSSKGYLASEEDSASLSSAPEFLPCSFEDFAGFFDFNARQERFVPENWDREDFLNDIAARAHEELVLFEQPPLVLPPDQTKAGTVVPEHSNSINLLWLSPKVFISSVKLELYFATMFCPVHDYNFALVSPTHDSDLYVYDTSSFRYENEARTVPPEWAMDFLQQILHMAEPSSFHQGEQGGALVVAPETSLQFLHQMMSPLPANFFKTIMISANERRNVFTPNFLGQLLSSLIPPEAQLAMPVEYLADIIIFKVDSQILETVVSHGFNPHVQLCLYQFDDSVTYEILSTALRSSQFIRCLHVPELLLDPSCCSSEPPFFEGSGLTSLIMDVPPGGIPLPMLNSLAKSTSLNSVQLTFDSKDDAVRRVPLLSDTTATLLALVRSCSSSLKNIKILVEAAQGTVEISLITAIAKTDLVGGVPRLEILTQENTALAEYSEIESIVLDATSIQLWDKLISPSLVLNSYWMHETDSRKCPSPSEGALKSDKSACGWIGMAVRAINRDFFGPKSTNVASLDTSIGRAGVIFEVLSSRWPDSL